MYHAKLVRNENEKGKHSLISVCLETSSLVSKVVFTLGMLSERDERNFSDLRYQQDSLSNSSIHTNGGEPREILSVIRRIEGSHPQQQGSVRADDSRKIEA